jgi:hypothetical protein
MRLWARAVVANQEDAIFGVEPETSMVSMQTTYDRTIGLESSSVLERQAPRESFVALKNVGVFRLTAPAQTERRLNSWCRWR